MRVTAERLERRQLLAASVPLGLLGNEGFTPLGSTFSPQASPLVTPAAPYSPAQIRHYYGLDSASFNGVAATGAGQTIAIIAVDNEPNIKTDLATFDAHFGLAAPPSFVVENQNGSTTSLPASNTDYGEETALDVEWSHAMAPAANIVLIEITDNAASNASFFTTFISTGVNRANLTAGVSVVSMSYGAPNYSGEAGNDSYFQTPGITYLAAAGDSGSADTDYPAASPYVVAVGGTSIYPSDASGTYGTETTWNESADGDGATGGGIDTHEPKPAYQSNVTQSSSFRTTPDVSMLGDPDTGVDIYDTYGDSGYVQIGGTSLSTPLMAGIMADVNQGRASVGLNSLTGYSQTLPRLYQLSTGDFHDITSGTNNYQSTGGYSAGVGYDLASGLGTPLASKLIPDLAGGAAVTGRVFSDNNTNGVFDGTDSPLASLAGKTVYLDLNNNGLLDSTRVSAEPTATIAADGTYIFNSLVTGGDLIGGLAGTVRLASGTPSGYVLVGTGSTFTTTYAGTATANIGLFPVTFTDSTAGDAYTVLASPTSSTSLQVLINGTVAYSTPVSLVHSLSFNLTGTGDSLAVDFANGNPVPAGGLSINGSSASAGFGLSVLGSAGNDSINVSSSAVVFGTSTIGYSGAANLSVDPRGGNDSLRITGAAVTLPASTTGVLVRQFSTLTLSSSATLVDAAPASHASRTVLEVASLSIDATSTLDLTSNDMDISASSLSAVNQLVTTARAQGNWTGPGITSSTAAGDLNRLTALGVIQNNQSGSPLFAATTTFDGLTPGVGDVLVKFTYYGDANLGGAVDGSDYSRIDVGYASAGSLTGWYNGDFNYDGVVDGSDYTLIDNAFNQQMTALPSALAAAQPAAWVAAGKSDPGSIAGSTPKIKVGSAPPPVILNPADPGRFFSGDGPTIAEQLFGDDSRKTRRGLADRLRVYDKFAMQGPELK